MALKRPHPKNYAMYDARGKAKYQADLKKYLADKKAADAKKPATKKPAAKKPATKKPAAKKPAAKKPAAKKPVAKKPAVKKPAVKKPAANKPATTTRPKRTANQLKIKKAATTAQKAIKKATPVVKKAAKTVAKKAGEAKKAISKKVEAVKKVKQTRNPRPKTPAQKAVYSAKKNLQKYGKQVGKKAGKDAKQLLKIKNLKSARGGVLATAGSLIAQKTINKITDTVSNKLAGRNLKKTGAAKLADVRKNPDKYERTLTGYRLKGTGPQKKSSTTKQKKANTTPSSGLKIKPTQYSSSAAKKKQNFGGATGTKKADKRFGTFREGSTENRKLQLERQSGNKETYSRKLSPQAKKTKTTPTKSSSKKMHAIEKRNRERFGDAHVDRLKRQHEEFKKRRKKK